MTPKQLAAGQHNRLLGNAAMIRRCAFVVAISETASPHAKDLGEKIEELSMQLDKELRAVRIDPVTGDTF